MLFGPNGAFSPDYGAANEHIAELMKEREDFIEASKVQAERIRTLQATVATLREELQAAQEQSEVQALFAQNRANQLEELQHAHEQKEQRLVKLRKAMRLLWGLLQGMSMRVSEQSTLVSEGNDLLETLDELLDEGAAKQPTPERAA